MDIRDKTLAGFAQIEGIILQQIVTKVCESYFSVLLYRHLIRAAERCSVGYASVNSLQALALFLPWMANSRGWGLLSCQVPQGGDKKRGQRPRPPSTFFIDRTVK